MTAPTADDFRRGAAVQSGEIARGQGPNVGFDGATSLCLPFPGDPTLTLYRIAVVPWALISSGLLLFLFGIVLTVLILTPWVDATLASVAMAPGSIAAGLVVAVYAASSDAGFDRALARRLGPRMKELESRIAARYRFAIEDPATYRKQKVISEDYAFGGLDSRREGLLLDGLRYRYVVRPQDVTDVREDKNHLLITYTVRGAPVALAVTLLMADPEEAARIRRAIRDALTRN
jgi:hypothetical protein